MVLYHGTDETHLAGILAEGLQPRAVGRAGNWGEHMESVDGFVYLTPSLDWRYAVHAASDRHAARTDRHALPPREVLIEVNVGAERLHPDEDHLRTLLMYTGRYSRDEAGAAVDADVMKRDRDRWRESLELSGSAAHLGPIRPKQVRRVLIIERALVPTLTELIFAWPYISASGKYDGPHGECCRQVHRWLWGDVREVSSVPFRIADDGSVHAHVGLPPLPSGVRHLVILRHGEIVNERAA